MGRSPRQPRLDPPTLLAAYASGAFPMADPDTGAVDFYACDPRCILPLERFHVPTSLARVVRARRFTVRFDTDFEAVIRGCATDRGGDNRCWISPAMIEAYRQLHALGFAHSVEAWLGGVLVGGLYGVRLGSAFFGESMFARPELGGRDASKVCLVHLVERLREGGFTLLDSQYANDHILRFGAIEISAAEYLERLEQAIETPARW